MKEALEYIINSVPYNSIVPFMIAQGIIPDERFGGNCLMQNSRLGVMLRDKGIYTTYVSAKFAGTGKDRLNHYATICREDERTFFLDPYLYPVSPIEITDVLADNNRTQMRSYPNNLIEITSAGSNSFSVSFIIKKSGRFKLGKTYNYNLLDETYDLPTITSEEFTDPNRSPLLRCLLSDDELMSVYINPLTRKKRITKKFADGTSSYLEIEREPDVFNAEIQRFADKLGVGKIELDEHLDLGSEAFLEVTKML